MHYFRISHIRPFSPGTLKTQSDESMNSCFAPWVIVKRGADIGGILAICLLVACSFAFAESTDVTSAAKTPDMLVRHVRVTLDVNGELTANPQGKKVIRFPMKVRSEIEYDEKDLPVKTGSGEQYRLFRYYQGAKAQIEAAGQEISRELDSRRRFIVVDCGAEKTSLFSPLGPMSRDGHELIDIQAGRLGPATLLPSRGAKVGDAWRLDERAVSDLFVLEAVNKSDIKLTLKQLRPTLGVVALAGTISGAVGGVSSDISLEGEMKFDPSVREMRSLSLIIKEKRAIGHATPGFEVEAKLVMNSEPATGKSPVSSPEVARLPTAPSPETTWVDFRPAGSRLRIVHDPRWQVLADRSDKTILRLVDKGVLVAQCNIASLPDYKEKQEPTLKQFQSHLEQTLGSDAQQVVDTASVPRTGGGEILRVVTVGEVEKIPVQWIHYLITDGRKQQALLVFTLESSLVRQFGASDQGLVGNLHFPGSEAFDGELSFVSIPVIKGEEQDASATATPKKGEIAEKQEKPEAKEPPATTEQVASPGEANKKSEKTKEMPEALKEASFWSRRVVRREGDDKPVYLRRDNIRPK